jgi:hypothetical protein
VIFGLGLAEGFADGVGVVAGGVLTDGLIVEPAEGLAAMGRAVTEPLEHAPNNSNEAAAADHGRAEGGTKRGYVACRAPT